VTERTVPRVGRTLAYMDLHDFDPNGADGLNPWGGVSLDSSRNLYGTTFYGGSNNYGTVWQITNPQASLNHQADCPSLKAAAIRVPHSIYSACEFQN